MAGEKQSNNNIIDDDDELEVENHSKIIDDSEKSNSEILIHNQDNTERLSNILKQIDDFLDEHIKLIENTIDSNFDCDEHMLNLLTKDDKNKYKTQLANELVAKNRTTENTKEDAAETHWTEHTQTISKLLNQAYPIPTINYGVSIEGKNTEKLGGERVQAYANIIGDPKITSQVLEDGHISHAQQNEPLPLCLKTLLSLRTNALGLKTDIISCLLSNSLPTQKIKIEKAFKFFLLESVKNQLPLQENQGNSDKVDAKIKPVLQHIFDSYKNLFLQFQSELKNNLENADAVKYYYANHKKEAKQLQKFQKSAALSLDTALALIDKEKVTQNDIIAAEQLLSIDSKVLELITEDSLFEAKFDPEKVYSSIEQKATAAIAAAKNNKDVFKVSNELRQSIRLYNGKQALFANVNLMLQLAHLLVDKVGDDSGKIPIKELKPLIKNETTNLPVTTIESNQRQRIKSVLAQFIAQEINALQFNHELRVIYFDEKKKLPLWEKFLNLIFTRPNQPINLLGKFINAFADSYMTQRQTLTNKEPPENKNSIAPIVRNERQAILQTHRALKSELEDKNPTIKTIEPSKIHAPLFVPNSSAKYALTRYTTQIQSLENANDEKLTISQLEEKNLQLTDELLEVNRLMTPKVH